MKRYLVVFALFLLSMITYIDRVAISSAKGPISDSLGLDDTAMGAVFSAFALGYALAQIPSGWLADRFGPRLALTAVVLAWSAFTGLTAAALSLASLIAIRFVFGAGEAGAFPGSARAIYNWLPPEERGRANGVLFSGSRVGAAVSFPLLAWMLRELGWRRSFVTLGAVGIVWAVFWWAWFRDHPSRAPSTAPRAAETDLRFSEIFRSKGMLLAMAQYFAGNFTFFICLSWMLPYLKSEYKLSDEAAAGYAMVPLLFGASAQWVSGFFVDSLYRSRLRAWSRRLPAIIGFALAVGGMLVLTRMDSPAAAVACFTLATFGADMTISPSWAYCVDIGGRKSGAVSGSMNMLGNIGSFASANAFPYLYRLTGSASAYFGLAALLDLGAIVCWIWMRPVLRTVPR